MVFLVNAEESVRYLIEEGSKVKCEDTKNVNQDDINELPEWYDDEKFKRGQKFFHDHIWALMLSKFCGLMVILSENSILDILVHTKKSNTTYSAYRRYIQTVFHMYVWYHKDFKPGSKLWKSMVEVRNKHNAASKSATKCGLGNISQRNMVVTQFGFMGFAAVRPRLVGLYDVPEEDWDGFFHVWRVVGYLLGIEDRFNVCSGTPDETRKRCHEIIRQVFLPNLKEISKAFEENVRYLCDGLWSFNPGIEYEAFMIYIFKLCGKDNKRQDSQEALVEPTSATNFTLKLLNFILYFYRYYIFRIFMNYVQYSSFWLIENFPFLAYYQFGYNKSHVSILK